jgi:hypothetical protein
MQEFRHSAGNFAWPFVMVNVFFMQILHRPFFVFQQVFYLSLVTSTPAKICRNADSVASSGRLKLNGEELPALFAPRLTF